MDGRAAREKEEHVLMESLRDIKIWLIQNTLRQWVSEGMTHEEARELWREMEKYAD